MTCIIDINSKRRLTARLAAGIAISAVLAFGFFAAPANADWNRDHHSWHGRHDRAPPVVYGSPYRGGYYGSPYYAPPVVYGPSVGISLPFVGINIR
jgi:hypothetical protein